MAGAAALASTARAGITLPIYLEDSHAGSFYWLAEHLDLEEPCTLLHFDAHSDASAIFDSDKIRTRLRRVASKDERAELLRGWRRAGTIQCFDWIEPLMPAPIGDVIWIARGPSENEKTQREQNARRQIDAHLEAAPRVAGSFAGHYRARSLSELEKREPLAGPLVVTIDLDYFGGLPADERAAEFERVWHFVVERPNLRAITIAISRPFLADDDEANALLELALRKALSLPTAKIEFAPYQEVGRDHSLRARGYRAQHREVPAFALERASPSLRAVVLANQERISVLAEEPRWRSLLQRWRGEAPAFRVAIKDRPPSTDGIWRIPARSSAEAEILSQPWDSEFPRVQWIAEVPEYARCNLASAGDDKAMFAVGAPPRPRWREVILPGSDRKLSLDSCAGLLDPTTGCGSVRLKARIEARPWIRETPTIEIRRSDGKGFRAALREQFGLPYLFGSGALRAGANSGPETGWGADCSNFIAYALRRQGLRVPWSNPKQLRRYLEPMAERIGVDDKPNFTADELERGLVVHLGSHVAAVLEDRPPLGVLDAGDIVAHQLEGVPALISVGDILRARKTARFDLLRVTAPPIQPDLIIGGDVMLGRSVGEQIEQNVNPFAGISSLLARGQTRLINLECVPSDRGEPASNHRFHLRAPLAAIGALGTAGINFVSLANNHAADFGPDAFRDAVERLRSSGIKVVGVASEPAVFNLEDGRRVALLALDDTRTWDRPELGRKLVEARSAADFVIEMVHWGEENSARVTDQQRAVARWLIDHGVDLVVGSHSHCLQPLDYYHGRPIVYSLGNLVFDGASTVPGWNRGALLEVSWRSGQNSPGLNLVPVRLDARGFPQPEARAEVTRR